MKSVLVIFSISLLLFFCTCQKNKKLTVTPIISSPTGKVSMNIDKVNIPKGIAKITATLNRSGFNSLSATLNVSNDDSAGINFTNVPVDNWHLTLEAKNDSNVTLYSGESDVLIMENIVTQVNCMLFPVSTGIGGANIHVSWGSSIVWNEHPANPILRKIQQDNFTDGIQTPCVIYDKGIYKMWYSIVQSGFGIGYATSSDGISWVHNETNPVLSKGAPNMWDGQLVAQSVVIRDSSVLRMYYFGKGNYREMGSTGLATSSDGIIWEKYRNPILTPSPGTWDEAGVGVYSVIKIDSIYLMYYTGTSLNNTSAIGLAISVDGIHWTKYANNPIMVKTETWEGYYGIYCPSVIFDMGIFKMVYMSNDIIPSRQVFGYATSLDGKTWKKANGEPFFKQSMTSNSWASIEIAYPYFHKFGDEYRVYFNGHGLNGTNEWSIGLLRGK